MAYRPLSTTERTIPRRAFMLLVPKNPLRAYICVHGRFSIVLLYIYSTYGSSYKVTGEEFFILYRACYCARNWITCGCNWLRLNRILWAEELRRLLRSSSGGKSPKTKKGRQVCPILEAFLPGNYCFLFSYSFKAYFSGSAPAPWRAVALLRHSSGSSFSLFR